jgi:hypothetical protein
MTKTIFGWLLIIAGLAVIGVVLYFSYAIFTGKMQPPNIFKPENNQAALTMPINQQDLQNSIDEAVKEQIQNIVPPEFINQLFNLIAWSVFACIAILGGAKISAIGIKMLKKES